jgi:eukaryotic-like serine/threonine-protein kinase
LKWSYTTGAGTQPVQSSPAVANGVVYVGSDDYKVYALNASTGALPGSFTTGDIVETAPAVANGVVYIGANDFNLYALNARTGPKRWSALNASTGAKLWSYGTGGGISSPAVANGVVYVGSYDGISVL